MMNNGMYTRIEIDKARAYSLAVLISSCARFGITLSKVYCFMNGFQVCFEGFEELGDAILHDGSYGNKSCYWETIGFPWDNGDVSIHTPNELACMLYALKTGRDWKEYEEE